MDFLSPVSRSDSHAALSNIRYLLTSSSYYPWIHPLIKSSIMWESFQCWGSRFGVSSSITMGGFPDKFPCDGYAWLCGEFDDWGKILSNRDTEHPISSLWPSKDSLRWCPLMHSLFPNFISAKISLPFSSVQRAVLEDQEGFWSGNCVFMGVQREFCSL